MARRYAESFRDVATGVGGNGGVPVVGGGAKVQPFGHAPKDMDFEKQSIQNREEFMALFSVPKTKMGITDKVDRATAKVFEKQIWTDSLIPMMSDIEDQINTSMLRNAGLLFKFDTSNIEALRDDRETSVTNAETLHRIGYPLNEISKVEKLGYSEIDEEWAQNARDTLAPAQQVDQGTSEPEEQTAQERNQSVSDSVVKTQKQDSEFADLTNEQYLTEYHKSVINTQNTTDYKSKLVNYWNKMEREQSKLLEDLNKSYGLTKQMAEEYLFNESKWTDDFIRLSSIFIQRAMELAHKFDRRDGIFSDPFDPDSPVVAQVMQRKISLSKNIPARMHNELKELIANGIENQTPTAEIAKQISERFKTKRKIALDTAITEMNQSSAAYRWEYHRRLNLNKIWIDSGDNEVRTSHREYAGLGVRNMEFEYNRGLKHPNDMGADAAEIINCRCTHRVVPGGLPL